MVVSFTKIYKETIQHYIYCLDLQQALLYITNLSSSDKDMFVPVAG